MERDRVVLAIYEQLLELEQRLIPVGLHVFGQAPDERQLADTLFAVAAFDRPEAGIRSLPNLIAEALGLPDYPSLVANSAASAERLEHRQRIEVAARNAVAALLASGADAAAEWLQRDVGVPGDAAFSTLAFLDRIRQDAIRGGEMEGLLRGLRGEYIEPGPGADIVQNPSVLPTGRNTHAVNPYGIPSQTAFLKALALDGNNAQARRRLIELDTRAAFVRQDRKDVRTRAMRTTGTEGPEDEGR